MRVCVALSFSHRQNPGRHGIADEPGQVVSGKTRHTNEDHDMTLKPVLLAAAGLLATGGIAHAAAHAEVDDTRAAVAAEFVFAGTVERVDYAFSDDAGGKASRIPHTFVTYRIEKILKGSTKDDTITLRFIGGRGDQAAFLMVSGMPMFDVGDRDVLFVRDNGASACPLVDCAAGRYRLIQGKVFSEDGQAVEVDADGKLTLRHYYDLPEVMTHKVSMTTLTRRDQLDDGEERREFRAPGSGAHLSGPMLVTRIAGTLAERGRAGEALVESADRKVPFALEPMMAEAPPAMAPGATDGARAPVSDADRAEIEALAASGGDPVLGERETR